MNKQTVSNFIKRTKKATVKHAPEILTGIGITGMVTSTVLAVKATPKALKLLGEKREWEERDELTPVEVVKTAWRPYIPAAVTGAVSIGCLIGASSVNVRRQAALAFAYNLATSDLAEYREKVKETVGEKKEKAIRDEVRKEKIEANPVSNTSVIVTGKGKSLCYDTISSRYFESDIDRIKRAEVDLNYRMLNEMYVSLSDLYDELGLEHTKFSDEIGWTLDKGKIKIEFYYRGADDGTPCLVMDFENPPQYDFSKLA